MCLRGLYQQFFLINLNLSSSLCCTGTVGEEPCRRLGVRVKHFFKLLYSECFYIALLSAFSVSASHHLPYNVNTSVSVSLFSLPPSLLCSPLPLPSDCFLAPLTPVRQSSTVVNVINFANALHQQALKQIN